MNKLTFGVFLSVLNVYQVAEFRLCSVCCPAGSGGSTLRFRQIRFFTCCLIASFLRKYTTGFRAEFKGTASNSPKLKIALGDSTQAGTRDTESSNIR